MGDRKLDPLKIVKKDQLTVKDQPAPDIKSEAPVSAEARTVSDSKIMAEKLSISERMADSLRTDVAKKDADIERLTRQNSEASVRLSEVIDREKIIAKNLESKQNEIAKKDAEIERLTRQNSEASVRLSEVINREKTVAQNLESKQNELAKKDAEIARLTRQNSETVAKFTEMLNREKEATAAKDEEIKKLSSKNFKVDGAEETIRASKIAIEKRLGEIETESITLRSELRRRDTDLALEIDRGNAYKAMAEELASRLKTAEESVSKVDKKMATSYTPEDISNNLNTIIDQFNNRVNSLDPSVGYMINAMDVDLKAQVFTDDEKKLRFLSGKPSSGEEAISTIKISIRAVPK